jgi:hypothetical protein
MTSASKFLFAVIVSSTASCFAASIPKTILPDNVLRCEPNAGCVNKTLYGRNYKVLATPRFTVMVSISREGIYTRADVSITNNTDMPLSVSPEDFRIEEVSPKPKVLLYVPPAELNLPPAQPIPATSSPQIAPQPKLPAAHFASHNPEAPGSGAADAPEIQNAEMQKTDREEAADKAEMQQHLAATSISPNEATRGRVYFESDKKAHLVNVVIPIAGVVFEFPYTLKR